MLELNEAVTSGNLRKLDETHFTIQLKEGELNQNHPCFVSDEQGEEYVLLSANILKKLLEGMKKAQEERFAISLERDIANQMPLDFEDVLSVAKAKLQSLNLDVVDIDSSELIGIIRKEHPNLFFNIDDYLRK